MIHSYKLRWRLLIVFTLMLVGLWPVKTQSAPDWSVCVVDESNNPVSRILVRESYQNYSAEWQGHEEDLYTDARGCVQFAPKTFRSSLVKRMSAIFTSAMGGVHASFGPYADVTAFSGNLIGDDIKGGYEYAWEWSPSHMDSLLVLRSH